MKIYTRLGKSLLTVGILSIFAFTSCQKNYSPDEPLPQEFSPTLYASTNNEVLYAIDVEKGDYNWKVNLNGKLASNPTYAFNHIYVGTESGTFYRIDYKTGEVKEEINLGGSIKGAALEYNDHIIVAAGTKVYALNPVNFEDQDSRLFTYTAAGNVSSSPTAHFVDGLSEDMEDKIIFFTTQNNQIIAINKEGSQVWNYVANDGNGFDSSPNVTNDSFLYVGNNNGKLYNLYTRDGSVRWIYETNGPIKSSPILVDGNVMFGSYDRTFYSVDSATGLTRWTIETDDIISTSPVFYDMKVYFGSNDQNIYSIDIIDGEFIWKKVTFGLINSSPIIFEGSVFIGSYDKNIYKLDAQTGQVQWAYPIQGQMQSSPIIRGINNTSVPSVSGSYVY
ncbi:MAG TPA: PQQ-binding-like beta-propeller repeat protein [Chitinophagaceae bacterium]|nr:PQQ-binding-like beta-propeller repeat protein [Chitinophagaceae bacterium]